MSNQVYMISKYAEKLNMLAEKRQFTEIFPFEAYHKSEELELPQKMNMIFLINTPKLPKISLYLADPKNCVG